MVQKRYNYEKYGNRLIQKSYMWAILISAVYLLYIYTVYRGRPWAS